MKEQTKSSTNKTKRLSIAKQTFYVQVPIYNCKVWFYFNSTFGLKDWAKEKFNVNLDEAFYAGKATAISYDLENAGRPGHLLVAIDNPEECCENRDAFISYLVHETLHTAITILENRGIPVNAENDEVLAYLQQFLFENALKEADAIDAK